jgi:hypothetical protein
VDLRYDFLFLLSTFKHLLCRGFANITISIRNYKELNIPNLLGLENLLDLIWRLTLEYISVQFFIMNVLSKLKFLEFPGPRWKPNEVLDSSEIHFACLAQASSDKL